LSVPAEADFEAVVQVAARAVAIRSGLREEARTRLHGAVEAAFAAVTEDVPPSGRVVALLAGGAGSLDVTFLVDPGAPALRADRLAGLPTEHELSPDGRTLRLRIAS
jgi:hypothetical protein